MHASFGFPGGGASSAPAPWRRSTVLYTGTTPAVDLGVFLDGLRQQYGSGAHYRVQPMAGSAPRALRVTVTVPA